MNKRYLGIGIFFAACSLYSLFNTFQGGFDFISSTLMLAFGFLSFLFLKNCR